MNSFFLTGIALALGVAAAPRPADTVADGTAEQPCADLTLEAGPVRVIVAPSLGGRVMAFHWDDGPNLFWTNPDPSNLLYQWKNHGGEKTWIGPQETWAPITGRTWPPPDTFDAQPYAVTGRTPTSATLLSGLDTNWNLRVERTIAVTSDALTITSRIIPAENAAFSRNVPPTHWAVAQFPPATRVDAHLVGLKRIHNGMDDSARLPDPIPLADDVVRFSFSDAAAVGKCGLDADRLVAEFPSGRLTMRQVVEDAVSSRDAPDRAQIFFGHHSGLPAEHAAYMELEFALPWPHATQTIRYTWDPSDNAAPPHPIRP